MFLNITSPLKKILHDSNFLFHNKYPGQVIRYINSRIQSRYGTVSSNTVRFNMTSSAAVHSIKHDDNAASSRRKYDVLSMRVILTVFRAEYNAKTGRM